MNVCDRAGTTAKIAPVRARGDAWGRAGRPGHDPLATQGPGEPIFPSQFGELVTLPRGMLLAFDQEGRSARTNRCFPAQGITMSRVRPHIFAVNGFLVATEPEFPSLELANAPAGLEGVLHFSSNWQIPVTVR